MSTMLWALCEGCVLAEAVAVLLSYVREHC